ncbi:LysR substrate-binding domain-containing protein [Methylocapsa sp. S129]|uniref:LysR substrate-binding domain-containing protein n=1 Tax=Methylocapsa sp. S129 TaxID=1641869 RepID=UPI00131DADA6
MADIGCVVPRNHRLAGYVAIEPEDLRGEVLITFAETTVIGFLLRERLRQLDAPINISITTNQALVACTLAAIGAGLSLIDPFLLLSDMFPSLMIIPHQAGCSTAPKDRVSAQSTALDRRKGIRGDCQGDGQ